MDVVKQLAGGYCSCLEAPSAAEAAGMAERQEGEVILAPARGGDCGWKDVVRELHRRRVPFPVLVVDRCGDEAEWVEVLEAGAFDLLVAPFTKDLVVTAIEQAASSQRRILLREPVEHIPRVGFLE